MGCFHASGLRVVCTGKCALLESKQFTFEQGSRDRGTIHFHERSATPWRTVMNKSRQDFLACSGLAQNENRNIQAGGATNFLLDCLHRLRRPEVNMVGGKFDRMSLK